MNNLMVRASLIEEMATSTKDNSKKVTFMDWECIFGQIKS